MFFDYPQTEMGEKRVHNSVRVLEEYFKRLGKKYVASDDVTIADISLACSMTVLEAVKFDFSQYPLVMKWYSTFKKENPEMWVYPQKASD
jgi:glutathione S-transferase